MNIYPNGSSAYQILDIYYSPEPTYKLLKLKSGKNSGSAAIRNNNNNIFEYKPTYEESNSVKKIDEAFLNGRLVTYKLGSEVSAEGIEIIPDNWKNYNRKKGGKRKSRKIKRKKNKKSRRRH
jgi:hypothetical protein